VPPLSSGYYESLAVDNDDRHTHRKEDEYHVWRHYDDLPLSHVKCSGSTPEDTRCLLYKAFYKDGTFFLIAPDDGHTMPNLKPVLCSVANAPPEHVHLCPIRVISQREAWQYLSRPGNKLAPGGLGHQALNPQIRARTFPWAVGLYRLNANNPYHNIFEDMMAVHGMMREEGMIPSNPVSASLTLEKTHWALLVTDKGGPGRIDEKFWPALVPGVHEVVPPRSSIRGTTSTYYAEVSLRRSSLT